jgi:chaperonin GroES
MSFSPGEWKQVNNTGDDIRKSIIPLPVREPSGVLFNLLGLLKDAGQQISSVSDMMMGQSPGQNQPATTSMAVLEQGLQVYSSIYKRLYRALTKEFKKLYKLNATYLPYRTYFQVLGTDEQQGAQISVLDYDPESIAVVPSADPNVASEAQKLMKAQGLMELVGMGTINPMEATKRVLEAQEQPNIEALMQMPDPQPNPEVQLEAEKLLMEREKLDVEKAKAQDESEREWAKLLIEMENSENKMGVERLKTMLEAVGKEDQRNLDMLQKREERNERNETRNSQLAAEPGNPAIS